MARTEYTRTRAIQKVEVCLDHNGKREHIKMKQKPNIFESTGAIQTLGVGLDHKKLDKSSEPNEQKQRCGKQSWRSLKSRSRSRSTSPLHHYRRNESNQIHSEDYREKSKSKSRSKTPRGQYTSQYERKRTRGKYSSHSKSRSRYNSSTHEQYTSHYPINDNEEMTLSSIGSRHSPKHNTHQIADTLQSKKCETNDDKPKDEVNITSGKHH